MDKDSTTSDGGGGERPPPTPHGGHHPGVGEKATTKASTSLLQMEKVVRSNIVEETIDTRLKGSRPELVSCYGRNRYIAKYATVIQLQRILHKARARSNSAGGFVKDLPVASFFDFSKVD